MTGTLIVGDKIDIGVRGDAGRTMSINQTFVGTIVAIDEHGIRLQTEADLLFVPWPIIGHTIILDAVTHRTGARPH
jgi:hypothetical protein